MKRPNHSIGDLWELAKSGHHVDIRRASKAHQRDGYDIIAAWAKGQDRSFARSRWALFLQSLQPQDVLRGTDRAVTHSRAGSATARLRVMSLSYLHGSLVVAGRPFLARLESQLWREMVV